MDRSSNVLVTNFTPSTVLQVVLLLFKNSLQVPSIAPHTMPKKLLPLFARPPLQHSDCSMRLARQRGLQQLSLKHHSKSRVFSTKQHNIPSSKQHNIKSKHNYKKANNSNNRRNQHQESTSSRRRSVNMCWERHI